MFPWLQEGDGEEQAVDLTNLGVEMDEVVMANSATVLDMETSNGAVGGSTEGIGES